MLAAEEHIKDKHAGLAGAELLATLREAYPPAEVLAQFHAYVNEAWEAMPPPFLDVS